MNDVVKKTVQAGFLDRRWRTDEKKRRNQPRTQLRFGGSFDARGQQQHRHGMEICRDDGAGVCYQTQRAIMTRSIRVNVRRLHTRNQQHQKDAQHRHRLRDVSFADMRFWFHW